jgi:hypothetical protein
MAYSFEDIDKNIWNSYYIAEPESPRNYIGASSIGHLCDRRIWLGWKGYVDPQAFIDPEQYGKNKETFARGHREEEVFINKLNEAGYTVDDQQVSFEAFDGNLKGHCDGTIYDENGELHILEIKTMKEKYFNAVKRDGIAKHYPNYISQVQLYMHYLFPKKTLFVCLNKNVDWEHYYEIIDYDPDLVDGILYKVTRIMEYGDQIPERMELPKKGFSVCKYCDYLKFCHPEYKEGK